MSGLSGCGYILQSLTLVASGYRRTKKYVSCGSAELAERRVREGVSDLLRHTVVLFILHFAFFAEMRCACRILPSLIALLDVRRRQEKWSPQSGVFS